MYVTLMQVKSLQWQVEAFFSDCEVASYHEANCEADHSDCLRISTLHEHKNWET